MKKKKNSTLYPHAWYKSLSKIPKEAAADIYLALHLLDITGEMTVFEPGSIQDILFSQFAETIISNREAYEEECKNRSEAAKAREAKKAQATTKKHEGAQAVPDKIRGDVIRGEEIRGDVSGGGGEDPAGTTTTTDLKEAIVEIWNSHDFVQKIRRVDNPAKRWERTEMAIAVAGGKQNFLELLRTLDQHAYLKNQPESGYSVIYDWFVDPENFQNILDGRYRDSRGDAKKYEGWEVVEFG